MTASNPLPAMPPSSAPPSPPAAPSWPELLGLALALTLAIMAVPIWSTIFLLSHPAIRPWINLHLGQSVASDLVYLLFALLLAATTPRRSGLRLGTLRPHLLPTLIVVAVPIILTALIYPRLSVRPFRGASFSMWLISPVAQDILFSGYLYGLLAQRGGTPFFRRLPLNPAVLLVAVLFAFHHLLNVFYMPLGFFLFQLFYTFLGALWTGFTRVWTGTFLYVSLAHITVNFIVWYTS